MPSKDELSFCAFRSQLLMRLQDAGSEVRREDSGLVMAWTLDQAIKAGHIARKHRENPLGDPWGLTWRDQGAG